MAEAPGLQNNEQKQNRKKLKVFLIFLVLSTLFWSLIKLSKEYISEVEFTLSYSEMPKNKLIQNEPETTVKLTVKTIGFKLLRYAIKEKVLDYSLTNIERKKGSAYYSETRSNMNFLQAQLSAETVVLDIQPDTLFFDLGVRSTKKVPIGSKVSYEFKTGFNFVSDLTMEPTEVEISGPQSVIDTIEIVETKELKFTDISETIDKEIELVSPHESIELSIPDTRMQAQVDKITDGSYMIDFQVINLPKKYMISTYPKQVKVIYQVALKDYNKIPENSFRVQCDYMESERNELTYLIPKIVEKPDLVSNVKIVPNKVEFLVKK